MDIPWDPEPSLSNPTPSICSPFTLCCRIRAGSGDSGYLPACQMLITGNIHHRSLSSPVWGWFQNLDRTPARSNWLHVQMQRQFTEDYRDLEG